MDLVDAMASRVICGDGAMGTLLLDQGIPLQRCFEELCVSDPKRIREIHQQYIAAGARVIETNSFGANAVRLERFGFQDKVAEINHAAVRLAIEAGRVKDIAVAGSVGPLGITGAEARARGIDRSECFREQITALLDGGADLIFLETFTVLEEMEIAFRIAKQLSNVMVICSFAGIEDGCLADGMPLVVACEKLRVGKAEIVGINCMSGARDMVKLLNRVGGDFSIAAYPSAGFPSIEGGRFSYDITPSCFAKTAHEMIVQGAGLIGGCCGTTPRHVEAIALAIANSNHHSVTTLPVPEQTSARRRL